MHMMIMMSMISNIVMIGSWQTSPLEESRLNILQNRFYAFKNQKSRKIEFYSLLNCSKDSTTLPKLKLS
jgi:hypothetical protein